MKLSEAFPSKYLKAEDLGGRNVIVTIASAGIEGIGQNKDRKLVLSFYGKEKTLVCNKTNATTIGKLYGDDTNAWIGKQITLTAREVDFQGEPTLSIRVSLQAPTPIGTPVQSLPPRSFGSAGRAPVTPEEEANLTVGGAADMSDVPFASVPDILI